MGSLTCLAQTSTSRLPGVALLVGLTLAVSVCSTADAAAAPRISAVNAPDKMVQGSSYIVTSVIRNPERVKATGKIRVTLSTSRPPGPWVLGQRKVWGVAQIGRAHV